MTIRKALLAALMAFVGFGAGADVARADSYWNHNGSVMRLVAYGGNGRTFYYQAPRQGMAQVGVRPGTLFFDGRRDGDSYSGTARVFSAQCGPMTFQISGYVASETRVVLEGWRPVFRNCRATGETKWDQLVFDYMYSD